MTDLSRLVLDANIMVSALIGRSFSLIEGLVENGVELFATDAQIAETRKTLAGRPNATSEWVENLLTLLATAVEILPAELYEIHESRARRRLHLRGQPDWPVLAASYETEASVWSHDKDFFGSGAPVWSTFMLGRQLETVANK